MKVSIVRKQLILFMAISLTLVSWTAQGASPSEEEDLALAYGDKSFISIASGSPQPIAKAPSVASVITAEDIAAIGAADLDEVLETVPGLHVARSPLGYNPIYTIRGIATQFNPQILMLVNGIPITGVYVGDRSQVWGGMPVENIARIEVIRGPGSALYGADAFSGVVNIITKTSVDIEGTQAGMRVGSFNTRDVWLQHGGSWGEFDVAAYLRVGATDGQRETINADALTGTPFTLAPGPVNLDRDAIDGRIDVERDNWRLRAGYQKRDNGGTGAGVASVLDPVGKNYGERISSDLTYHDANFAPDMDFTAQVSYLHIVEKSDLTLFPPGTDFSLLFLPGPVPPGLGPFPNGVIGNPYKWERHLRFNVSATYSGLQDHKMRFGVGTQNDDLYRIQDTNNYILIPTVAGFFPGPRPPLGSVVDVTNTGPFVRPHSRRVTYAYAQDEWSFLQDWYLTAGVRRDHYSDFGDTTNPRIALVWETAYNLTSKLLYGRAFRPPSFSELYNLPNPVLTGNPDLKPESIESAELAFVWQAARSLQANLNLFRYQMKDILRPDTSGIAQNSGRQNGRGVEIEMVWDASSSLRLSGNYAYQESIDETSNQDVGGSPQQHVYARADWRFTPGWFVNSQFNYVAERKREFGDPRTDGVPNYHTVDLTLRKQQRSSDWDIAFTLLNLFDADAREPSPSPGLIRDDLPLPGRAWRFELTREL